MTEYHDLTRMQRDALVVIAGSPGVSGADVRDEFREPYSDAIYSAAFYPKLDDLEERGLIEREHADGRTHALYITREGEDALDAYLGWLEEQFQD